MPDFELFVGGTPLRTVTRGWVIRQMETVADEFEFEYADLRTHLKQAPPIEVGDACEIKLRGQTLLTGYVDDVAISYQADSLRLTARGRSKTGDLVDCSAVYKTNRFNNKNLEEICKNICAPFGIDVVVDTTVKNIGLRFKRFAIEPGETAFDLITRACKLRGVWPTAASDGALHIVRAGRGKSRYGFGAEKRVPYTIEYGKNIIRGERYDSWLQRHNVYLLKGQVPSDNELSGRAASQLADYVEDGAINRYRPLLLTSTGEDKKADLKLRAQWERNRRAGTGERIQYRVDNYGYKSGNYTWRNNERDDFELWDTNVMVKVEDPRLGASDWFLVSSVSYRWQAEGEDGGRVTDLTLVPREAFDVVDYPVRKKKRRRNPVEQFFYSPRTIDEWLSGTPQTGDR